MKKPRYIITLEDLTINDALVLQELVRQAPQRIQHQVDRQINRCLWPKYSQWRKENLKCAGATKCPQCGRGAVLYADTGLCTICQLVKVVSDQHGGNV